MMFIPLFWVLGLVACSEEKSEPLPDLAPIEIPKEVPGLYSGRMPCDDCTTKMVRMALGEDHSVEFVQTVLKDSLEVDTLKGSFMATDSSITVTLAKTDAPKDSSRFVFVRSKMGNLSYVTSAGTVYEDENGMRAELIRIFKAPVVGKKETSKE